MKLIQFLNSRGDLGWTASARLRLGVGMLMLAQAVTLPLYAQVNNNCIAPTFFYYEVPLPHIITPCMPAGVGIGETGSPSFHVNSIDWTLEGDAAQYCKLIKNPDDPPAIAWSATVIVVDPDPKPGTVTIKAVLTPIREDPSCTGDPWPAQTLTMDFDLVVDGEGCSSCGTGGGGGNASFGSSDGKNNNGPDVQLPLGLYDRDTSSGFLWLSGQTPSTNLAQPSVLRVPYKRDDVTVIPTTGTIQQVKSPQGLVRVVDTNSTDSKYDLEYYYNADVYWDGSRWQPNVGISPFVKWTIANPSGNANVLQISEYHGITLGQRFTYTYDTGTSKWSLTDPDGIRTILSWETVSGGVTDRYREVKSGSTTVEKTHRTFQLFGSQLALTQLVEGDGSTTRTTTYTPYDSGVNIGRPKRVDYPDGRWEMFEYDDFGRTTKHYEAYKDIAPPTGTSFPADYTCKLTEYSYYSSTYSEDVNDSGNRPDLARRIAVKIPADSGSAWAEISRILRSVPVAEEIDEQVCPVPEIGYWGDPANLTTVSIYYADSTGPRAARLQSVHHRDATATLYDYTSDANSTTVIENAGELDTSATNLVILNGTHTETVYNNLGQVTARTSKLIQNGQAPSTILAQETYTYESYDPLQRDYHVVNLANRTNFYTFDCCGLESMTDQDGATTTYDHDTLKRQVAETRFFGGTGIKTTNTLDAAGRVLATQRIGTNGTSIITLSQSQYDVLGRIITQTNALNGITSYSETVSNNKLQRTATYPDGGTRIETYYRDGRLEKLTGTAVAGRHYVYGGEQESGYYREYAKDIKLDGSGNDSSEWVKNYLDGASNSYKNLYADNNYLQSYFNNKGQRWKQRDADGVATLYQYNGKGELITTATDLDQDDTVDRGGTGNKDRVRDTVRLVTTYSGSNVQQTEEWVYTTDGSAATNRVAITRVSTDGLKTWRSAYKDQSTEVITSSVTSYGSSGARTNTVTNPDGSSVVSIYSYGRLLSVTRKDSSGGQVIQTTYAYDVHGRTLSVTDARNGATVYGYNNADQAAAVTTPAPGTGQSAQTTTSYYNAMLQATNVVQPDGASVTNEYFTTGLLKKTYGSRTYPVEYTYDPQGRVKTMKTWQDFTGNAVTAITTWNYDSQRGWLLSKDYADATTGAAGTTGPDYTYTAGGRLKTRTWARTGTGGQRIVTTYTYGFDDGSSGNQFADQVSVAYSNDPPSTPTVTYTYDRRGRRATAVCNSITTTYTYNDADQPLTESYSGGTLAGLSVNNVYDSYLRRTTAEIKTGSTVLQGAGYAYDTAGRVQTVTDNSATSYTASYAYLANSAMVSTLTFKQSTTTRLTATKQYDFLNRLQSISSTASGSSAPSLPVSFLYQYNDTNQRTRATLGDGSYWVYTYDKLGQVISGNKYWQDGTPVNGQQFNYGFDDIGNRTATGGRASAASAYTRNRLNQYTQRTVAGVVDVLGVANPTAGVTVNGNAANRRGDYFHWPLTVNNVSAAQYPTITVVSQYGATQTTSGAAFVPAATESYTYDTDGDLTGDGRWNYTWDAENRLIELKRDTSSPTLSSRLRATFEYDNQGRRIRKTYYTHNGTTWVEQTDTVFLYDGWNLMGELDANNSNAKVRTYIWGLDLSGSNQGAGRVGGLLKVTDYSSGVTHNFVAFDGNGNVAALIDGTTGAATARYEYGPFGEVVRATGPMAKVNPFRFSTKYQDDESDLLMYPVRPYNPSTGRWLTRDPIEEDGGLNLYGLVANNPVNEIDNLGFCKACTCKSVRITFFPGEDKWQADFYSVGGTGAEKFGTVFIITWKVEGDETKCRYFLNETGSVTGDIPKRKVTPYTGTGGWVELFFRVYRDHSGVPFVGDGKYKVKYNLDASYACEDSDGTRMETTPTKWKNTFTGKWPKKN